MRTGMESVRRVKSLPDLSSPQPVCCCVPGTCASDHQSRAEKTSLSSDGEDDEVVPQDEMLNPLSPSQSRSSAATESENQPSCHHMDSGSRENRCNSLSIRFHATHLGREEGVIASEDPDKKGSRQMCVRVSAGVHQPPQKLRPQHIFSLLAATASVTIARPPSGTDLLSLWNKRMSPATDGESSSSVETHQQMPETSAGSTPRVPTPDPDFEEYYFPDNLILKELSEMRQILQKLLEQNKELSLITSPLVADDDILSAVLGLRSPDAAGQISFSLSLSFPSLGSLSLFPSVVM